MIESVEIGIDKITPSREEILRAQGIPKGTILKDNIRNLIEKSVAIFLSEVKPSCIIMDISKRDFEPVFLGEGINDGEAPLAIIFPQSEHLTLFALTMGAGISLTIEKLFEKTDFAIASMLDSVASLAADSAVEFIENRLTNKLAQEKKNSTGCLALSYSPGYCGWHITAQKKLFQHLHPEQIGIALNDSCLMTPIKSVTGVLVYGNKHIHSYQNNFNFCYNCKANSCIERAERILNH